MEIRAYTPADAAACAQVYFRGAREGAAAAYSETQRAAWAPEVPTEATMQTRLSGLTTFVAERDGQIVGFMSLDGDYLDFAYVLPEEMGRGTADALYAMIVNTARVAGFARMTTAASHLARRFFEKRGWRVEAEQQVERHGAMLTNFRMFHVLTASV